MAVCRSCDLYLQAATISHRHAKSLMLPACILIGLNGCASLFVALGKQNQENYWQYDSIQNINAFLIQDNLLTICFTGFNTATQERKSLSFDISVRPGESHEITSANFKHLVGDETYGEYIRIPSNHIHSGCKTPSKRPTVPVMTFNFTSCNTNSDMTNDDGFPIGACPELQQDFLSLHAKDKSIQHAVYQIKKSRPYLSDTTASGGNITMMAFVSVSGLKSEPNRLMFSPEPQRVRVKGISYKEPLALVFDIATFPLQILILGAIFLLTDH